MPKKKSSNKCYYAVRIGRKPGIYKVWDGENGANKQISQIHKYNHKEGYIVTRSWEEADNYMRTQELFVVTSDYFIRRAVQYSQEMSKVDGELHVIEEDKTLQSHVDPDTKEDQIAITAPSVPYYQDENMESFLQKYYPERSFTDEQKAAIQADKGAHLLYAIPGSGKTAVLTARAGYLIHRGVPAENILIMTFGKKAAEHMKDVFRKQFPSFHVPLFCTIHSFCYQVIRKAEAEGVLLKKHKLICDEEDDPVPEAMDSDAANAWIQDESPDEKPSGLTKREDEKKGNRYANPRSPIYLLESILTKLEICKKLSEARGPAEQAATVIGCIKNRMMTEEEIQRLQPMDLGTGEPFSIWPVYEVYQRELAEQQTPEMDFDDMLILALEVLKNPDMQAFWQGKYPYICVDEAQDTSLLQHAIVEKLHRTEDSLFMVGDDDQSIYAFRGAMPEAMLAFEQRYEGASIHRMGVNFRSDKCIVVSGDQLIRRNQIRADKPMNAFSVKPGEIRITDISAAMQGKFLLDQALQFCADQEGKKQPESLAILYRNNASALLPLAYFFKYDVPFTSNKVFDILTLLYSRTAINILAFLNFVQKPDDFTLYSRAYTAWNCYHGLFLNRKTAVENLQERIHKDNSGRPILQSLQTLLLSLGEGDKARHIGDIWSIIQKLKMEDKPSSAIMTMLECLEYNKNRFMKQSNVQLLVMALIQIASLYDSISSFVDAMLTLRAKKKWDEHNANKHPVVTLSTMHSAKGQEYDHVIIIDALEGLMPGDPGKPLPFWNNNWREHVEEERRLFYVAATRAKHDLRIVVNGLNSTGQQAPCTYIHELLHDSPDIPVDNLSAYIASNSLEERFEKARGNPYYAVRVGKVPGIYRDYETAGVKGFPNNEYRKCASLQEAKRFLSKAVPCMIPESMPAPDVPLAVHQSLLGMFSVSRLKDMSENELTEICKKTDWLFSKDANAAKAVNYANCALEYALMYLPVNLHKVWQPLKELLHDERLPVRDEYKHADGVHPIRILEMGVGPGTATLGVLSFYAMLAEANPSVEMNLEYSPVEFEQAFLPVFDMLTGSMIPTLPANLHVCINSVQVRDAFDYLQAYQGATFDLILESNMLNHNERVAGGRLDNLLHDINRVLSHNGKFIAIEPADKETAAFLDRLTDLAVTGFGFSVMGPKNAANDVSGVKLYQEAIACGLRRPLEEDRHWFRYTVMTKQQEVSI